ncbi:Atu4866 domain-containing protein [Streptomyces sp. NPDC056716]|uniref:Atu4866 domain-containing protein n=1 Tax=unclassified Streptomyces TaxID=2593676 RepID=UPI00367CEDE7
MSDTDTPNQNPKAPNHSPEALNWNPKALHEIRSNDTGRPVLFTNARILTMDPLIGTMTGADLLFVGSLIVGVGPAIVTAAQDDNAIVVDCVGMTIAPAVVDTVALAGGRAQRSEYVATLTPGNVPDFLVLPDALASGVPDAVATALTRPEQVRALVAAGRPVRWAGADVPGRAAAPGTGIPAAPDLTGSPRVGVWIDRNDFLHQELTADGRYDETRGGRPHAYQGRYWTDGDRIDYLDDLGFWAYGEFRGDELHHAGYVMKLTRRDLTRRALTRPELA